MPVAAYRRVPVTPPAQQQSRSKTFIAPTRGWIANENLAASKEGGALRLENWFPTQNTIRLRGGSQKFATIGSGPSAGDPVEALFNYKTGATERFFAANDTAIYDITAPASPSVSPTPAVSGQTSGYYSTAQFATAGGEFLYAVNGANLARLYDGTRFRLVNGLATLALAYDAQTVNFVVGGTLTGGTSGATGTIVDMVDAGATGTLYLQGIAGTFQDNELITSAPGSATANGVAAAYSSIVITGIATSALSQVAVYRSRLYFVQGGTLSAWYLDVDSLGGVAAQFALRGVFQKGGSLLFIATWSIDVGDGQDDRIVFVTTEGEVAVYEGSYPGGTDWSLVGRYVMSQPLGKNATMKAGGDLLIATKEGIVPLSAVLTKDPAALSLAAVSAKIEPEWKTEVLTRGTALPWQLLKWPSYNMMLVALPAATVTLQYCFVFNVETGADAKYTGWDTRCLGLFSEWAYFGTSDGRVMKCETGGSDNGTPYSCVAVCQFSHMKSVGRDKLVHQIRSVFKAAVPFAAKLSVSVNYAVQLPSAPVAASDISTGSEWDVGLWDTAIWDGAGEKTVSTKWASIGRAGFVIAPQVQVTCGQSNTPDAELVSMELTYEDGGVAV